MPKSTGRPAIPLFERLQIESQSNCNRACWFCPRTYDRSGKYLDAEGRPVLARMPTGKIVDLLDQAEAMGFRGRVDFYHYSEPLLEVRCVELAEEAKRRGMKPAMHTNGDALERDPGLCERICGAYDLIVVGLYDHETDEQLEQAKRYWRGRISGPALEFSVIGPHGALKGDSMGVPRALVPTDQRMALPDLTYRNAPCHRPLIRLIIQYDGTMCHCCEDTQGAFGLGNVYESTLEELWYSERHLQAVHDLIAGERDKYALCRNCPLPPTGPPVGDKQIEIVRRQFDPAADDTRGSS